MNNEKQCIVPGETSHWYKIYLLGEFRISGETITVDVQNHPKIASILAYLILADKKEIRRSELARIFYPDHQPLKGLQNIRASIHNILKLFPELLVAGKQTCALNGAIDIWVDSSEVLTKARQTSVQTRYSAALHGELRACADLYKGELLPGCAEEWLDSLRAELRIRMAGVLKLLCKFSRQTGDFDEAMIHAQKLNHIEPDKEDGHQEILKILRDSGETLAMMNYFESYQQKLRDEIGEDPLPETFEIVYGNHASRKNPQSVDLSLVPYIGREAELMAVQHNLRLYVRNRLTKNSGPKLTTVSGVPGSGKTSFVAELSGFLANSETDHIVISCKSLHEYSGFALVRKIINECCVKGITYFVWGKLSDFSVRVLLEYFPELRKLFPTLSDAPDIETPLKKDRLFDAIRDFLASLACDSPFVIIVEDLHWILEDDLQLVLANLDFLRSVNIYFVATFRPQEFSAVLEKCSVLGSVVHSPATQTINLHAFDYEKTMALAAMALNCETIESALAKAIYGKTGGNPYFITKTVHSLRENDQIVIKDNTAFQNQGKNELRDLAINKDIEELILESYNKLSAGQKRIMEIVCTASFPVESGLLRQLAQHNPEEDAKALARWQYIRIQEQGIVCYHELLRNAIYLSIDPSAKRRLHEAIYRACVAFSYHTEIICYHAIQADLVTESFTWSVEAAKASAAIFAYKNALDHSLRAIELAAQSKIGEHERIRNRTEVLKVLREIYIALEQFDKWKEIITELERSAEILGDAALMFKTRLDKATDFFYVSSWEGNSLQSLMTLLAGAKNEGNPVMEAQVLQLLAQKHRLQGDYEKSEVFLRTALDKVGTSPTKRDLYISCCIDLANILTSRCKEAELSALLSYLDSAIDKQTLSRNLYLYLYIAIFHSIRSMDFSDALEKTGLFISTVQEMGVTYNAINGHHCRSIVLRSMHQYKAAEESLMKALELNKGAGIKVLDMMCKRELANIYLASGRLEDAMELVEYLIENKDKEPGCTKYQNTKLMEIKIYILQHDCARAENLLHDYISDFPTSSLVNNSIFWLLLEILLFIEQGKYIEALDSASRLLGIAEGTGKKAELWATEALSAYCYANLGNIEHALTLSTIAYKNLERCNFNGNTSFLIQLYHFLVLKGTNRLQEAYAVLETAYNRLITYANKLEDEKWISAFLANIPEHQALCREWEQYQHKLEAGTVLVAAAADHSPKRGQLKRIHNKKISLTLCHPADEAEENSKTLRLKRIARLSKEAEAQHAVLSAGILAELLKVSRITIIRDLQELEASGLSIKTRGHLG